MLQLDDLIGHFSIKACLKKLLSHPPSTLLFQGPKGVGKAQFAKAFAYELLADASTHKLEAGNHPDLRIFMPEGKAAMHPMQEMKRLIEQVHIQPFESARKVFLIYEADRMLPSSSNALLKTLEEPPAYAHFILITHHREHLLKTIVSRSFELSFFPLKSEEIAEYLQKREEKDEEEARQIAWLSQGRLDTALSLAKKEKNTFFPLVVEIGVAAAHRDYPHVFHLLAMLESEIDKSRLDELEEVLGAFYFWQRDRHLLKLEGKKELLFFKEYEKQLEQCAHCPLPDLHSIQRTFMRIQSALTCHLNFRHCLTDLLLTE